VHVMVFRVMTLYNLEWLECGNNCFRGMYCFHLKDRSEVKDVESPFLLRSTEILAIKPGKLSMNYRGI
jgi:hypothetical protein